MHSVAINQINQKFALSSNISKTIKKKTHQNLEMETAQNMTYSHRSDFNTVENLFKHLPYEDQKVDHCNVRFHTDTALEHRPADPHQKPRVHQQGSEAITMFKAVHIQYSCAGSLKQLIITNSQA